jgi:hypothetical protein
MKVLDPIERVSEIIFGLLMAQAITGSLSVASAGSQEVRTVMVAALGCNIAWGLVDGIMYLVQTHTERVRRANLALRLRSMTNPPAERALIAEEMPERLAKVADEKLLEAVRERLQVMPEASLDARLRLHDYGGAVGVFALVVLSTFPVVVPFMFIDELKLAMRLSNLIALLTLFAGGWILARYSGGNPWKTGAVMAAIGAGLSGAIMALGG